MAEPSPLKVAFARRHPDELAALLAAQPHEERLAILHALPGDASAAVIAKLPHGLAVGLLATQSDETISEWLARASLDDALTLVLHLPQERRQRILAEPSLRHMRRTVERLVVYPKRTVGALVDPTAVRITATTPLHDAIAMLRAGEQAELEWIWIADAESRYVGLLDVGKALLTHSDRLPVGELAVVLEPLRAETALVAARELDEWLRHPELPVIDHQRHLLGTLSRQRLMDALRSEEPPEHGLIDGVSALTREYFRVMSLCLGGLLTWRERR